MCSKRATDASVQNSWNDEAAADGPWAFGVKQGSGCRCFSVELRDRNTLIFIIERESESGSVIHSDTWTDCRNSSTIGYRYFAVIHQENYVNPATRSKHPSH